MSDGVECALCGKPIPPNAHYIVRIDVFADPSMPEMTSEQLAQMDADSEIENLLDQMKSMSEQELQDQVHRRFEFTLCRACQREFLVNPLGKPRRQKVGEN
jgi:hypothetical protein